MLLAGTVNVWVRPPLANWIEGSSTPSTPTKLSVNVPVSGTGYAEFSVKLSVGCSAGAAVDGPLKLAAGVGAWICSVIAFEVVDWLGSVTVIFSNCTVCSRFGGTVAVTSVAETYAVATAVPFTCTTLFGRKPVPVSVTVVAAAPRGILAGETCAIASGITVIVVLPEPLA